MWSQNQGMILLYVILCDKIWLRNWYAYFFLRSRRSQRFRMMWVQKIGKLQMKDREHAEICRIQFLPAAKPIKTHQDQGTTAFMLTASVASACMNTLLVLPVWVLWVPEKGWRLGVTPPLRIPRCHAESPVPTDKTCQYMSLNLGGVSTCHLR